MKKVVFLPLDERPCNYDFVYKLFQSEEIQLVRPEKLGSKKKAANPDEIREFLLEECKEAYGLILSVDMLLYGGLIPSRMHHETEEVLKERLSTIRKIKEMNSQIKIYAFHCIMRCPSYNSAEEEPDYYAKYGADIFKAGVMKHKYQLKRVEEQEWIEAKSKVPADILEQFESRREVNRNMNMATIDYYEAGYLDALVFPQDDSAPFGYTAIDQMKVRTVIQQKSLTDEIILYSGADEVALSLTARFLNDLKGIKPKVYVKYATDAAKYMYPSYEGVRLGTTIAFHILSAGCVQTENEDKADIYLAITAPDDHMEEAPDQPSISPNYNAERNMAELMRFVRQKIAEGKRVAIADNAYANGGELDLIRMLNKSDILTKVSGYAGWNTNGNTLGTVLAEAVYDYHFGKTKQKQKFLMERYIEDMAYCGHVRGSVTKQIMNTDLIRFENEEAQNIVSEMVKKELYAFVEEYMTTVAGKIDIQHISMPWKRMFEVKLDVNFTE